jgi:beta-fructofuranosidase
LDKLQQLTILREYKNGKMKRMKNTLYFLVLGLICINCTQNTAERAASGDQTSNEQRQTGHVFNTSNLPFISLAGDNSIGDPFPVYWDGVWHLYALVYDLSRVVHYTSTDLVKWIEHEPAMSGQGIATGTVVRSEGTYYMFYTDGGPQTIRVVTSDNPWYFDFNKSQLVAEADDKTYIRGRKFRDPYIFFNEEEQLWWMIPEAQCPEICAGLFKSKDLVEWSQHGPIYRETSEGRLHASCPQIWESDGRWYLACLDYGTWYFNSESPYGPWEVRGKYHNQYLSAASRSATDGQRWLAWGFFTRYGPTPESLGGGGYGGPLGVGRQLVFNEDGTIGVQPLPELITEIRRDEYNADLFSSIEKLDGEWTIDSQAGTITSTDKGGRLLFDLKERKPDYYYEADFEFAQPDDSISLVVRTSKRLDRGYRVVISPEKKIFAIRQYKQDEGTFSEVTYDFPTGKPVNLKVFVSGNLMEAFIAGQKSLSNRIADRSYHWVVIETSGSVVIRDPLLHYFNQAW